MSELKEYIKIPLTKEILSKAEEMNNRMLTNTKTFSHEGKTKETTKIGIIGELIFLEWLKKYKIDFTANTFRYLETGSNGDFIISGKRVKVKTTLLKDNNEFLMSKLNLLIAEYMLKKIYEFYVQIFINSDYTFAYISGFIYGNEVKNYEIVLSKNMYSPNIVIPIPNLKPMISFLEEVKNG